MNGMDMMGEALKSILGDLKKSKGMKKPAVVVMKKEVVKEPEVEEEEGDTSPEDFLKALFPDKKEKEEEEEDEEGKEDGLVKDGNVDHKAFFDFVTKKKKKGQLA